MPWWPLNSEGKQQAYLKALVKTPSSKGSYYYGACVDAVAGESDTTNNCSAAVMIEVSHNKPDLLVGVWGAHRGFVGTTLLYGTTVYNSGGPSEPTTLRLLLLPSPTSAPSAGTEVGEVDVPKLVVTEARLAYSRRNVYRTSAGGWDGSSFKLGASVRNLGGPSAATTLRFYQSPDDVITPSDVEVDSTAVPALVKEQPHTPPRFTSSRVTVTAPATPGTYYYGACVDALTRESDTTNNCSRAFYTVRK